jgi:hypothetical protein
MLQSADLTMIKRKLGEFSLYEKTEKEEVCGRHRLNIRIFSHVFRKIGNFEEFTKTCKRRNDGLNAPVKLALGTFEPVLSLF